MGRVITLLDEQGRRMWAFAPSTDPYRVLHAVAWAYPRGEPVCGAPCPAVEGQYCIDCHAIASAALTEARKRPEAVA